VHSQENGMKNLITWFLNQAMFQEALQQAGADSCERTHERHSAECHFDKMTFD
jgi:hypothetical protein